MVAGLSAQKGHTTMPYVYSPRTLAIEWNCSERHVRNLINSGKLEAFHVGKLLRIETREVEEYRERNSTTVGKDQNLPSLAATDLAVSELRLARIQRKRPAARLDIIRPRS